MYPFPISVHLSFLDYLAPEGRRCLVPTHSQSVPFSTAASSHLSASSATRIRISYFCAHWTIDKGETGTTDRSALLHFSRLNNTWVGNTCPKSNDAPCKLMNRTYQKNGQKSAQQLNQHNPQTGITEQLRRTIVVSWYHLQALNPTAGVAFLITQLLLLFEYQMAKRSDRLLCKETEEASLGLL